MKVAEQWRYVDRAIDQVIDVFVSARRDTKAARRFFQRAIGTMRVAPVEVVTATMRRCTRQCSRSCSRRPGIEPTAMPTTGSRPTMAG